MTLLRGQLLTTGPLALIAACYMIAAPSAVPGNRLLISRETPNYSAKALQGVCQQTATQLDQQLSQQWKVIVHSPFVLAGDCPQEQLERYYAETIVPTARALAVQYFDLEPAWPITIILCSSDEHYRECNQDLGERDRSEYSGTYSRSAHRIIVNIATGEGTLAHELTHALAHADFPDLPEWFDEGLASLYEECEFSGDGLRLVGLENWRGAVIRSAHQNGNFRSIKAMVSEDFASADPSIEYAQARYFCLFLQKRNLLEPFYRKCRSHSKASRDELEALIELMGTSNADQIDAQFQTWLSRLKPDRQALFSN